MVWRFLKKTGMKPPYDPAIPFLVIHPEETKIEKRQPKCPSTDEGIKEVVVHKHNGILLSHKMEHI